MKNFILSVFLIFILSFAVKSFGAQEIEAINVYFNKSQADVRLSGGNWETTNEILVNGDTLITNSFISNGQESTIVINNPAFGQIFGSLMASNPPAINMDAITNALTGQTGYGISGFDTTTQDIIGNSND